jgi:two-component system nitrogen regulation sensor histidine kinase NtrY
MKTYIWQCAIRVILISLALTAACWLLLVPGFYFTALVMLLVAVSLFVNLIGFMRRRFRRAIDFLQAIRNDDFPLQYNTAIADPDTKELHTLLNQLSDRFKALRFENEARTRLLDVLLDHIPTAVLIVDHYGNIPVLNRTAMRLLQLKGTENIDVLQASMPELLDKISGESKEDSFTISLKTVAGTQQLNGAIYPFQSGGLSFQLISLQDITSQLNRQEVESWQKLMKVLTHEVMNSLTPVISLAGTAGQLLQTPIDTETQEELRQGDRSHRKPGDGHPRFYPGLPQPVQYSGTQKNQVFRQPFL